VGALNRCSTGGRDGALQVAFKVGFDLYLGAVGVVSHGVSSCG
jgi:hypothetical protein